jgi:single stranded DNA-binding protein
VATCSTIPTDAGWPQLEVTGVHLLGESHRLAIRSAEGCFDRYDQRKEDTVKTTKNCAHVIGNLTADPILRSTEQDRAVCNLTVASHEVRLSQDGDGYDQVTEFHQCVAWGQQAEKIHKRLRKGDLVSISGPLRTRTNKTETGTYRNTAIEVADWDLLHRPQPVAAEPADAASAASSA